MAIDTSKSRALILNRLAKVDSNSDTLVDETFVKPSNSRLLSNKNQNELKVHFCRVLEAHNTFTQLLENIDELPIAVNTYLDSLQAKKIVYAGANSNLKQLDWNKANIDWKEDKFEQDGLTAISSAECAIADTGTLVLLSSVENPTRNNFLAEHHIVVVHSKALLAYSEDAWSMIKQRYDQLPRAINFISGPSSSADVGLKLEYGAHGPRTLAVFIINN